MAGRDPEIGEEVLEEGCYHLSKMGVEDSKLEEHFSLRRGEARAFIRAYEAKLKSGEASPGDFDRVFWQDVKKEAEGDVKVTLLSGAGFHHSWKSELRRLDGPALMAAYEASKDFLGADPNQKFLDYPPPKGYDPLALDREVRRGVEVLGELLAEKWEEERGKTKGRTRQTLKSPTKRRSSKKIAPGHGR